MPPLHALFTMLVALVLAEWPSTSLSQYGIPGYGYEYENSLSTTTAQIVVDTSIPGEVIGPVAEYYSRRNSKWVPALSHWTALVDEWESGKFNVTCDAVPTFILAGTEAETASTAASTPDPSQSPATSTQAQQDSTVYAAQLAAWDSAIRGHLSRMYQWQTDMQKLVCS